MGGAYLYESKQELVIRSVFVFYGDAADQALATRLAEETGQMWNAPGALIKAKGRLFAVRFEISGLYRADLSFDEIHGNTDPHYNFFRVEEFSRSDISFVDEIGCNTGYFKRDNLLDQTTTIAHEYGHTLGLRHPEILDIRGKGQPGIMYPRGTWVDAPYQWDPQAEPGKPGGTLNPACRRVLPEDIGQLFLDRLHFDTSGKAVVGDFTNLYHKRH
ncbi:peptidase M10 [Compostibacter hankyongensis]|uniref:Peptidase M10 n=1 Tax=Compostibacter hankyongensis TaxID=1007089 RepID=A0ABP8G7T7_9BACT